MIETTVSVARLSAIVAWCVVSSLMTAAWVVGLFGPWNVSALLALTAGALAPFAALIHVRCYFAKMSALIHVAPDREPIRVHSVR